MQAASHTRSRCGVISKARRGDSPLFGRRVDMKMSKGSILVSVCAARCGEVTFPWLFSLRLLSAWESEFCFQKCCQNIVGFFTYLFIFFNERPKIERIAEPEIWPPAKINILIYIFLISWHPEHLQFHKLWPGFLPPPLEASTFALLLALYKQVECEGWWAHMGQNSSFHFLLLCFTKAEKTTFPWKKYYFICRGNAETLLSMRYRKKRRYRYIPALHNSCARLCKQEIIFSLSLLIESLQDRLDSFFWSIVLFFFPQRVRCQLQQLLHLFYNEWFAWGLRLARCSADKHDQIPIFSWRW